MTTMAARLGRNIRHHFTLRSFFSAGSGASIASRGMPVTPPAGTLSFRSTVAPPQAQNTSQKTSSKWVMFGVTGALIIGSLFQRNSEIANSNARGQVIEDTINLFLENYAELFNAFKEVKEEFEALSNRVKELEEAYVALLNRVKELEEAYVALSTLVEELRNLEETSEREKEDDAEGQSEDSNDGVEEV